MISATISGVRSRRLGVAARTAAPRTSPCSVTACSALSRGGRYTLDNIAPACGPCNTSKCNDEVTGWLRRKGFDEPAFLLRHLEIQTALAVRFPAESKAPETTAP